MKTLFVKRHDFLTATALKVLQLDRRYCTLIAGLAGFSVLTTLRNGLATAGRKGWRNDLDILIFCGAQWTLQTYDSSSMPLCSPGEIAFGQHP
jgi:hypothetical protein